ncbi:MAG: Ig-like domain repeat protein [Solirubrobacterales bacterium]
MSANRPAVIGCCLMLVCVGVACLCAGTAKASYYKAVLCAGNNGSNGFATATNTASANNPGGIFSFENYCGPAPYPAGSNAFLRIAENQSGGNAGYTAYGSMSWTAPPYVWIAAGGGYTREPNAFNAGWRGRFWLEGYDGSMNNVLVQGSGVANGDCGGVCWATTSTFASHLWPFGGYGSYRRFVFELTCYREAGCDRSNFNAVDANTMVLTLNDVDPSHISLTNTGSGMLAGTWVRGTQPVNWNVSDQGSGMRFERLRVDGGERYAIDWRGNCDLGAWGSSGEFARQFQPCPVGGPWGRSYGLDTATLTDGAHTVQVCSQDYGQAVGISGSGGESCDQRTIHVDNHAPAAPGGLAIVSSNPHRYLDHFGARWSLATDAGSPITKVHYKIVNAAGTVVVPEQTVSATNPTALGSIAGPKAAGDYQLRVWLEDAVGLSGPVATVPIPHDTTPPAAPQSLRVTGPSTAHWNSTVNLGWNDITDDGSPITTVHYEIVNRAGELVGSAHTVTGQGIEALQSIQAPASRGEYKARVWLEDEEGNTGAPASVPLPLDTTPPAAPQGLAVAAPSTPRSAEGFDVRWRNVTDNGSPIDAAHYQVLDGSGKVVVGTRDLSGSNPQAISEIDAPRAAGAYTLRVWLSDAEGNVGVPSEAPLAYNCVRSDVGGGNVLTAGVGAKHDSILTVQQGHGSTVGGSLQGANGPVGGAAVCVFSRVVTDSGREFVGTAMTRADGSYIFPVAGGPSRELTAEYRSDAREIEAKATIQTRIKPLLHLVKTKVRNKHKAVFFGRIPGPHNDDVVVVLQVKSGKGWRAFRRYRTRRNGRYRVPYRFTQTNRGATYVMRAQVRRTVGLPYEPGNSRRVKLRVLP